METLIYILVSFFAIIAIGAIVVFAVAYNKK